MSLAGELLDALEFDIGDLTIVPSAGGVFDVFRDGELVFSKKKLGRHAQPGEILALLKQSR